MATSRPVSEGADRDAKRQRLGAPLGENDFTMPPVSMQSMPLPGPLMSMLPTNAVQFLREKGPEPYLEVVRCNMTFHLLHLNESLMQRNQDLLAKHQELMRQFMDLQAAYDEVLKKCNSKIIYLETTGIMKLAQEHFNAHFPPEAGCSLETQQVLAVSEALQNRAKQTVPPILPGANAAAPAANGATNGGAK